MFIKTNGKLSIGFGGVCLSQNFCKSGLFNLPSASHVQVARITSPGGGRPQTSLFPWEVFTPQHVMVVWKEGNQEQAGWLAAEEDVSA